jgi:hypothetical protein
MKSVPATSFPVIKLYELDPAREPDFPNFCRTNIHEFLRTTDKAFRCDFFRCERHGQVFLLVLLAAGNDQPWDGGGIPGLENFLIAPNTSDFEERADLRFPPVS